MSAAAHTLAIDEKKKKKKERERKDTCDQCHTIVVVWATFVSETSTRMKHTSRRQYASVSIG